MAASDSIVRANQDPDGLDFASLRKEAIDLAQELSGKIWTDYNLHDPGVTILEQLCFGLTELAYQAGMSIPEYLSDQHGVIEYNQFALFKPHDILPNSAVTVADYRKLFIDAIPEIDAIHMERGGDGNVEGIFNITMKLLEPLTGPVLDEQQKQQQQKNIVAQVRKIYLQHRNLGEDLGQIFVEAAQPCFLKGVIEISSRRSKAEIFADVFFQAARKISSDVRIERYEDAYAEDKDLLRIFTGPLTQHGYIYENMDNISSFKPIQELNGVIAAIDGVKKVYDLELVDAEGNPIVIHGSHSHSFFLQFPRDEQQLNFLTISINAGKSSNANSAVRVNQEKSRKLLIDAKRYLQRLEFEYNAFRNNKGNAASFYDLPSGEKRVGLDYYSIQHHFPNVYGINSAGVPASESHERKIQAKQLKAYLYPLEQLMANFLQLIENVHRLFLVDETRPQSYFSQYLDDLHIPHIETLYNHNGPDIVRSVQARYDNYTDRKNRALNTLLAIYGESFPDETLAHFNDYHQANPDYWMIDNKIHYLQHLKVIGGARSKGFNQAIPQWDTDNISSFQKKIGILLGLDNFYQCRSLSQVVRDFNIAIVDDEVLANKKSSIPAPYTEIQYLPELRSPQQQAISNWAYQPGKPLNLSVTMLRDGIYSNNYRLLEADGQTSVYFQQENQNKFVFLKSYKQKNQAISYAHKFKKIIASLNKATEGFHLLEHVLLRPRSSEVNAQSATFFNFQLSLIFPAWTPRFSNPDFREFVQHTLSQHIPAHLFPNIYWLDFSSMDEFEQLYKSWLDLLFQSQQKQLLNEDASLIDIDSASQKLVDWLLQHRHVEEYWV